jgi:RNA polymerase sigma-70 factor (ECF subfamily)
MRALALDHALVRRLHARAHAHRWPVAVERFAEALEASAGRAFSAAPPTGREIERYLEALHLEDVALACACADGHEAAWEHFIREHRPALYRAAAAIDPTGGARELADSLYADLFGLTEHGGRRTSLFRYFHGRSSLSTWLRAVLAQRHVDRVRSTRRLEPLTSGDATEPAADVGSPAPERQRFLTAMRLAVKRAVARLVPRDRLRLACYYAQDLTLARIGRTIGEHEATVSRHLARTRRLIRADVEQQLREEQRMSEAEVAECFASVVADAGPLDLADILAEPSRKEPGHDRST